MNLSGNCVIKFVNYYNININDIFIIYDDKDYEIGKYKVKRNGSSGGHNGLNSIINSLNSSEIKRLKIGISSNDSIPLEKYVLSKFNKQELKKVEEILPITSNIINDFCILDFDSLMDKYNGII